MNPPLSFRTSSVCALLLTVLCAVFGPARLVAADWAGVVRCEIDLVASGYSHQETQTWTLAGSAPTTQGSSKIHAATWAVTGQGWHDRTNSSLLRRVASWTANVAGRSAPVSFTVTATGELLVQVAHSQLTAQSGYTGPDAFYQNGALQSSQQLQGTVYEWAFPKIVGQSTDTQLTGSLTTNPVAQLGPLQPPNTQITVTFAWALGQDNAPPLPPSALPPQPAQPGAPAPPPNPPRRGTPPEGSLFERGEDGAIDGPIDSGAVPRPTPMEPARDPSNFTARQIGEGEVELRWDAVPGVSTYAITGPRLPDGRKVTGTSTTITGVPAGVHEWLVTSWYEPDGSRTQAENWPRASLDVRASFGRYRVTIARVRIDREEPDKRFKQHGRNNEIFLTEHTVVFDRRDGRNLIYDDVVPHPGVTPMIHATPIHGDTHNANTSGFQYRIRAGSVAASGGIQTGDEIQVWDADQIQHRSDTSGTSGPGQGLASHASPGVFLPSEYQPFVAWEGNLNDGIEVVLIRPVVWLAIETWGGNSTETFLAPYVERVTRAERSRDFSAVPAIRSVVGISQLVLLDTKVPELNTHAAWLADRHRPFGLTVFGDFNGAPATFTDTVVVLTREKIESFLSGQTSKDRAVRISGTMQGQNRVAMGECTVFVKIERLPALPVPIRDTWTPPPELTSQTKGRYRVTGTRVLVHREEYDERFKEHGRNNEIAVSKHAQVIDRRTNAKLAFDGGVVVSPVHGDTQSADESDLRGENERRIRAGTVAPTGGIQTGDNVAIWTTAGTPSNVIVPSSELIPFVFWEGELNDGVEVVLIRPVVWLISGRLWTDSGYEMTGWRNAHQFLVPYMVRVANERWTDFLAIPPIRDGLSQPSVSLVTVPQLVTIGDWVMEQHRPFGIQVPFPATGLDDRPHSTWTDRVLVLTREKIEVTLGGRREIPFEVRFQSSMGRIGAVPMGDCSLFLKIEKLE